MILTDDEIEYRQKQEFQAFTDEETAFLRELGILKEEEEPLPETGWTSWNFTMATHSISTDYEKNAYHARVEQF